MIARDSKGHALQADAKALAMRWRSTLLGEKKVGRRRGWKECMLQAWLAGHGGTIKSKGRSDRGSWMEQWAYRPEGQTTLVKLMRNEGMEATAVDAENGSDDVLRDSVVWRLPAWIDRRY